VVPIILTEHEDSIPRVLRARHGLHLRRRKFHRANMELLVDAILDGAIPAHEYSSAITRLDELLDEDPIAIFTMETRSPGVSSPLPSPLTTGSGENNLQTQDQSAPSPNCQSRDTNSELYAGDKDAVESENHNLNNKSDVKVHKKKKCIIQ